jgi:hypothetical protein
MLKIASKNEYLRNSSKLIKEWRFKNWKFNTIVVKRIDEKPTPNLLSFKIDYPLF